MCPVDETAAWRFNGSVWHVEGISGAFKFMAIWLPLLVGVAILEGNFMWLMDSFEIESSLTTCFVVNGRANWLFELIIAIRGGEAVTVAPLASGVKFVLWNDASTLALSMMPTPEGDKVEMQESELVLLYVRLFFPDASVVGSKRYASVSEIV